MNEPDAVKLDITQSETDRRGAFRIGEHAELTYDRPEENVMRADHTLVDKRHRGKGIAHALYREMVSFARTNDRKVIPVCPFIVAMFKQNPKDADVLK